MSDDYFVKENTITLTRRNMSQDPNGFWNILHYDFDNYVDIIEQSSLTFTHGAMYYAWPNLTPFLKNNTAAYLWFATSAGYNPIVFPEGLYEIADIDQYVKFTMLNNLHYAIVTTNIGWDGTKAITKTDNMFFFQLDINPVLMCVTLTILPIPTAAQAVALNMTAPPGATWVFPPVSNDSALLFRVDPGFSDIIGFNPAVYPADFSVTFSTYQHNSDFTAEISPQSSVLISSDWVGSQGFGTNSYNDVFYAFTPTVLPLAKQPLQNFEAQFYPVTSGPRRDMNLRLYDQNRNPLRLKDPDVLIALTIRQKSQRNPLRKQIPVSS